MKFESILGIFVAVGVFMAIIVVVFVIPDGESATSWGENLITLFFKKEIPVNNCNKKRLVFVYAEKSRVLHKIKYDYIEVDTSYLGEKARDELYKEVQKPLNQLWKTTDEKDYYALSPYIKTMGEDVKKAVEACFDKADETVLRSRLPVLTESIDNMQSVLLSMQGEKEYVPYQILETMNRLNQQSKKEE